MTTPKPKYTDQIPLPKKKSSYNVGLSTPNPSFMQILLGKPRSDGKYKFHSELGKTGKWKGQVVKYIADDSGLQNKDLQSLMITFTIGSIHATGVKAAVNSLKEVMSDINIAHPLLYNRIKTAGMLNVRYMSTKRNKKTGVIKIPSKLSNHAWGCAIDLMIDKVVDNLGDNVVLRGLELISPIFNKHGWVWGGAYVTAAEDGMHFEVSEKYLIKWAQAGDLGPHALKAANKPGLLTAAKKASNPPTKTQQVRAQQAKAQQPNTAGVNQAFLKRGSKGHSVYILQLKLNHSGALPKLVPDSSFGKDTYDALRDFQRRKGLPPSGVLDKATEDALSSLRITIPTYIDRAIRGFQRIMK